ncbi:MAG TPA: S16 family serine protease, partial [Gemmatimonadales bacterium]|nr:S16 family serine protease [Gemmatimonadales bacterium]
VCARVKRHQGGSRPKLARPAVAAVTQHELVVGRAGDFAAVVERDSDERVPAAARRLASAVARPVMERTVRQRMAIELVRRLGADESLFWGSAVVFDETFKPRALSPELRARLIGLSSYDVVRRYESQFARARPAADFLARMTYQELKLRLPELLLMRVDKNPVFLLDEVDKLGVSFQGDPASALLEVLDPAQNDTFVDHYLGVPFDLSEVLFIATANFIQNIPGPLLDRMEVVEFAGYTEREKQEIARKYLIPRQFTENGVSPDQLTITDEALSEVITSYTRESGVRQLEREIGRLARKVARKIATREVQQITIEQNMVDDLLGRPKVHPEKKAREDEAGVATGMYYTPTGGDIMFVEASTMRGKGELVLTGQLGDVMKESARAAWTYARSHAAALQIPDEMFDRDIHIHVPAGAIPKDGPSAGVTMASAVVSALSGRPVRHDIAMTGEITLRGRVLPIGGVKEKVLGAVRAGINRIILPKANEPDLEDLPREVRDKIEVFLVEELGEVLAFTLRGATFSEGRLLFGDEKNPRDVVPLAAAGFRH